LIFGLLLYQDKSDRKLGDYTLLWCVWSLSILIKVCLFWH